MDYGVLKNKKCFVLDMDGTFYLGDRLLSGSLDFIRHIEMAGKDFIFFTNNTSRNVRFYVEKLKKMGCVVTREKIISSGMVTLDYIKKVYGSPRVFLVGTPMLEDDFRESGINLVRQDPDIVTVGFDITLTYEKLSLACSFIRSGKPFIATHPDLNCPTENGFIPDCGAICAFITASTGIKPKYLGKPYTETLEFILKYTGCSRDELAFVGDRLYTDIAIGANHGVTSILVLTGETGYRDLENSQVKPDFIFNRLADLIEYLV